MYVGPRTAGGDGATPGRDRAAALLGVVVFAAFVTALTGSVVGLALPDIAREFAADPGQAAWFMLSFLLAVTVLLLPAGRLGDLLGHGHVYLVGTLGFGAACVACALASSPGALIAARAAQGVASALVMATTPALTALAVSPARRGSALGLMSTGTYLGLALGPPIGGVLIGAAGWRSIFWASAVAGALAFVAGLWVVPRERADLRQVRFDPVGSLLIALGTTTLLLAVARGSSWGFTSVKTTACIAGTALILALLLWVESRHPAPTLDLALFHSRVFSSATLAAILNYTSLFIALFTLPFALRDGESMSPARVGLVLASQAMAMALLAWASGALSDRIGSWGLAAGGMLLLSMGLGALALIWPTRGALSPAIALFACGAGTGIFVSPNSSALMGAAPRERQGIAGSVMGLARNLGMSIGVAIGSTLLTTAFDGAAAGSWSAAGDRAVRTGLIVGALAALSAAGIIALGRERSRSGRAA